VALQAKSGAATLPWDANANAGMKLETRNPAANTIANKYDNRRCLTITNLLVVDFNPNPGCLGFAISGASLQARTNDELAMIIVQLIHIS
jgi:hypothetical protein